eukprot:CAMPEP_0172453464 /NCGR_PEP_ID=MMETSP1065-20121228/10769_1 /TAXON_ID=265537 /ORGANISM="Amphiprora paludosa, Strain CCMP125" /LENGTH=427 /DNA_ID=CAMNT_0013205647 /DNA_START=151 /DNA_END=1434 /DNA_ORIENTATION=+
MWKRKPFFTSLQASFQKGSPNGSTHSSSSNNNNSHHGAGGGNTSVSSDSVSVVGAVHTQNIVDERLKQAATQFVEFSQRLKELELRMSLHYQDLVSTSKSRQAMMQALTNISQGCPLQEIVASENGACYANALEAKQVTTLLQTFETQIVQYVKDWERTVATRVGTELKHVQQLYQVTQKYQTKVAYFQRALAQSQKQPSHKPRMSALLRTPTTAQLEEKLTWNESKLRNAQRDYQRNLIAVTLLTEEVTLRAWKELVPLLLRLFDVDLKASTTASQMATQVARLRQEMVQLAQAHEMDFQSLHAGRLRVLREEDAVDFVPRAQWQELTSLVDASPVGKSTSTGNLPLTPHTTSTFEEEEEEDEHKESSNVEVTLERAFDLEEQSLISKTDGQLKYPRYIQIEGNSSTRSKMDDETTLTGVPDMVSV